MRFTNYNGSRMATGKIETHDGTFYVIHRSGVLHLRSHTFNVIPPHIIKTETQHAMIDAWRCNLTNRVAVNLATK